MMKLPESSTTQDRIQKLEEEGFFQSLSVEKLSELKFLYKLPDYPEMAKYYGSLEKKKREGSINDIELSKKIELDQLLSKLKGGGLISEQERTQLKVLNLLQKK